MNTLIKLLISLSSLVLTTYADLSKAEELNLPGFIGRIIKIDGPYIYNGDGVPVIGWIVAHLEQDKVSFLLCSNKLVQVDGKSLKATQAKCPSGDRIITPWSYEATTNTLNVVMGQSGFRPVSANSEDKKMGETIEVKRLPASYQASIQNKKADDWAAITFKAQGKLLLGVVAQPK
jgi:hypothetical protein